MNKGKAPILGAIGRFIIFWIVAAIFALFFLLALISPTLAPPPPLKDSPYANE
jgi:hypothetical protein